MLLYVLVVLAGSQTACNKTPEKKPDYLRFTIDGIKLECDKYIQASDRGPLPEQLLDISGNWNTSSTESGSIEIECYFFNNTTGEKLLLNPGGVTIMFDHHFTSGQVSTDTYFASGPLTKLHVVEVTDRYIKGTFEFVVSTTTSTGAVVVKTITNGEFGINR